jgi:hypothetical protein
MAIGAAQETRDVADVAKEKPGGSAHLARLAIQLFKI